MNTINRRLSVAPMMEWTDRHCRYFLRLLSQHTLLYTEMVTTGALLHGDRDRFLAYHGEEHPLALQLGGSNPQELADCAAMAEDYGYDEVNLNVGCPSDRVQNGRFGACLMAEPALVADCMSAMQQRVRIPITIKTRLGIDERDSWEELIAFIHSIAATGTRTFILHARKAWLNGLSPKQNREIPPLQYDVVQRVKQENPQLEIIINGGITSLDQATDLLPQLDGVMIGREAYHNPYILAQADQQLFDSKHPAPTRIEVLENFKPYIREQLAQDVYLKHMTRHILGLFQGQPGARVWRRHLSENMHKHGAGIEVLEVATDKMLELQQSHKKVLAS